MRFFKLLTAAIIASATLAVAAPAALAATPFYSAFSDSNNSVHISISNADPFGQINFYGSQAGSVSTIINNLGHTDQSGSYSGSINPGFSFSQGAIDTYVTVNGQQSGTVTINGNSNGCGFNNNCNNQITASPSSVTVNSGNSTTVTLFSNFSQSFYINSSPNTSIATANLSGNILTVFGNSSGNTSVQVCASSQFNCVTVGISVNGGFGTGFIGFSNNDLNLTAGQTSNVFITMALANGAPNNGSIAFPGFYISSNSNPNVATASISGNTVSVFANSTGSTTFSVCSTFSNVSCGNLRVNVNGSFNGTVTFSNNNLTLNTGQSSTVYLSLTNGSSFSNSFYISSNSNPGVATATINGNAMTVFASGLNSGFNANINNSTTFSVCSSSFSSNNCGSLFVSVNGGGFGNLQFSPSSATVQVGQSASVSIVQIFPLAGNNTVFQTYYVSSTSNPNVASATLNGNTVTVYGLVAGSASFNICAINSSSVCGVLPVTVSGVLGRTTYTNGTLLLDNGTIYIMYRNSKTGFTNYPAFTGLGFQASNALSAGTFTIPSTGVTVSTSQQAHPWGSWVKNGSTVYFVHQSGLIPITSWDIFLNNGGSASLIVPMNSFDFQLPMLSVMSFNDSRLQ